MIQHGPGSLADPDAPAQRWGGRKAQQYVALTLATYGRVCWLCGLPGADSADHVIPRSKGGAVYDIQNLAPSHRRCNEARGNRDRVGPVIPIETGLAYFEGAQQHDPLELRPHRPHPQHTADLPLRHPHQ